MFGKLFVAIVATSSKKEKIGQNSLHLDALNVKETVAKNVCHLDEAVIVQNVRRYVMHNAADQLAEAARAIHELCQHRYSWPTNEQEMVESLAAALRRYEAETEAREAERKLLNVVRGYKPEEHHPIIRDALLEYEKEMDATIPEMIADVKRRSALAEDARQRLLVTRNTDETNVYQQKWDCVMKTIKSWEQRGLINTVGLTDELLQIERLAASQAAKVSPLATDDPEAHQQAKTDYAAEREGT